VNPVDSTVASTLAPWSRAIVLEKREVGFRNASKQNQRTSFSVSIGILRNAANEDRTREFEDPI
jgi:hypothetical protein